MPELENIHLEIQLGLLLVSAKPHTAKIPREVMEGFTASGTGLANRELRDR